MCLSLWGGRGEGCIRREEGGGGGDGWGGGGLEPKSPKVCVPKRAQINISFCKISFFPAMKSGSEGGGGCPPCVTFRLVVVSLRALDSHPFFPSHVASGRCVLSAAAAGALAGFVSAFAEPSIWCAGAVLNVAWCAVCASAAPNSWRIEDVLVVAGVI